MQALGNRVSLRAQPNLEPLQRGGFSGQSQTSGSPNLEPQERGGLGGNHSNYDSSRHGGSQRHQDGPEVSHASNGNAVIDLDPNGGRADISRVGENVYLVQQEGSDAQHVYSNGPITVNGTDGDDVIIFDDSVTEDVTINGGDGDDVLQGGSGDDTIRAVNGNDVVNAGAGDDKVSGGNGNDAIYAGSGNDQVWGGDGNDAIAGGSGNDRIDAGRGDDLVSGGRGNNQI